MDSPRSLELEELPGSLGKLVTDSLRGGEQIAWLGRPGKGPLELLAFLVLILGAGSMFLFGWQLSVWAKSPSFFWFVAVAVSLVTFLGIGAIFWGRKQERHTAYVVTNERALIVEQQIFPFPPVALDHAKTTSFERTDLGKLQLHQNSSDVGTLVFETRTERDSEGSPYLVETGFHRIPDAAQVHGLLLRLTRGRGWSPPVKETRPAPAALVDVKPVPDIADPPRIVPRSVQRRLFANRTNAPMMIVGGMFAAVSLVFIVPVVLANDRPRQPGEIAAALAPCVLFLLGVGFFLTPIIRWRRKVAVFRDGVLVRVRLIAFRDAHLVDPWKPFDPLEFDQKCWFTGIASAVRANMPASSDQGKTPIDHVLGGFGCVLTAFMVFGALTGLFLMAAIWFQGIQGVEDKLLASAGILAFFGAFVGIAAFMRRDLLRSATLRPTADVRFAFTTSRDEEVESTGTIDVLEWRARQDATDGPLALYLPSNSRRVCLLLGMNLLDTRH